MKCLLLSSFLVMLGASGFCLARFDQAGDETAYYTTATIKGNVTILNHPSLGKTAGSSVLLGFQRTDCPKATVATWTDTEGNYEIRVGIGSYKLIVRDGRREGETKDALAPNQQRVVDTGPPGSIKNFAVEVVVPDK